MVLITIWCRYSIQRRGLRLTSKKYYKVDRRTTAIKEDVADLSDNDKALINKIRQRLKKLGILIRTAREHSSGDTRRMELERIDKCLEGILSQLNENPQELPDDVVENPNDVHRATATSVKGYQV